MIEIPISQWFIDLQGTFSTFCQRDDIETKTPGQKSLFAEVASETYKEVDLGNV